MTLRRILRTAIAAVLLSAAAHAHVGVTVTQLGGAASGTATLTAKFQDFDCAWVGSPAFAAASLTKLPPPGIGLPGGALLLILPDPLFDYTFAFWGTQTIGGFPCEANFPFMPIPPSAAGLTIHVQSAALFVGPPLFAGTTPVATHVIFP